MLCVDALGVPRVILPFVACAGTVAVICCGELRVNDALLPLNFTEFTSVKFPPVIMTFERGAPLVGAKLSKRGKIVNIKLLVPVPEAVTAIFPVVAPSETVATICVAEETVNEGIFTPSIDTAVAPVKFVPVIVTTVPPDPLVGEKPVIAGVERITAGESASVLFCVSF